MSSKEEQKQKAASELRKRYIDFLAEWIPRLHAQGIPGRRAREQADKLWGEWGRRDNGPPPTDG